MSDSDEKIPLQVACQNGSFLKTFLYLAKVEVGQTSNEVPRITWTKVYKGALAISNTVSNTIAESR